MAVVERLFWQMVACVASISSRVIARKLEREQKKWKEEGERRRSFLLSPPPPPSFLFFFCSCPNFLDELARKRLLRRLGRWGHVLVVVAVVERFKKESMYGLSPPGHKKVAASGGSTVEFSYTGDLIDLNGANVSVKSKLQHAPPPGIPRAFDTFAVPGRREFDYQSSRGWGI